MTKSNGVDAKGHYQYHYDSKMTEEQRAAAAKKLDDMRESGKITITDDGYGLSQTFMEKILKEQIEAGNIVDKNDDGEEDIFTNMNKRNLGAAFEKTHKTKGYSTNFTKMKKGTSFEYTYEDLENFWESAGYTRKSKTKEEPAKPKEDKAPDNKPEPTVEDKKTETTPEVPTPKPGEESKNEESKNEKLDTVILDSTTYTDGNGNVIADDTRALVNGQPYHSKTGFEDFGTWDPKSLDDEEIGRAPTGYKPPKGPDVQPEPATKDKPLPPTKEINISEPPVAEVPVAKAPANGTPVAEVPDAKAPAKGTPVAGTPDAKAPAKGTGTPVEKAPANGTPGAKATEKATEKETPVAETPTKTTKAETIQDEYKKAVTTDPELADKTDKERAEILKTRENDIQIQISKLKQQTVVVRKTGLFGLGGTKTEVIATAEENTKKNKDKIASLEQKLDTTQRYQVYANAVAGNITSTMSSTKLVDKDGNTVASYPQYSTAKYKDANGQESYVAKVATFNTNTKQFDSKYYSFDVQKVNDLKGQPERWQAVPDMNNELTNGQEVR